jgi:hypothetical protein
MMKSKKLAGVLMLAMILSAPSVFAADDKGKKTGWGEGTNPPGYTQGEKTGWDGQATPPGQTSTSTDTTSAS